MGAYMYQYLLKMMIYVSFVSENINKKCEKGYEVEINELLNK